jgi:hypothetical protein
MVGNSQQAQVKWSQIPLASIEAQGLPMTLDSAKGKYPHFLF